VAGPLSAKAFSGAVSIARSRGTRSVDRRRTFSGSIDLRVPDSAHGTVTFNSFSGRLNSELPLTLHTSSRRNLRAELGSGGGGTLRFKTFSGSVKIDR
jgi:hypothetical protein